MAGNEAINAPLHDAEARSDRASKARMFEHMNARLNRQGLLI